MAEVGSGLRRETIKRDVVELLLLLLLLRIVHRSRDKCGIYHATALDSERVLATISHTRAAELHFCSHVG